MFVTFKVKSFEGLKWRVICRRVLCENIFYLFRYQRFLLFWGNAFVTFKVKGF